MLFSKRLLDSTHTNFHWTKEDTMAQLTTEEFIQDMVTNIRDTRSYGFATALYPDKYALETLVTSWDSILPDHQLDIFDGNGRIKSQRMLRRIVETWAEDTGRSEREIVCALADVHCILMGIDLYEDRHKIPAAIAWDNS